MLAKGASTLAVVVTLVLALALALALVLVLVLVPSEAISGCRRSKSDVKLTRDAQWTCTCCSGSAPSVLPLRAVSAVEFRRETAMAKAAAAAAVSHAGDACACACDRKG